MSTLDRFTRNLDWNLLKYFVQIARSGSIGGAAARMNVSQPSVSVALRRLEESVGAQLFVRSNAGVQLTEAGAVMLRDTEAMIGMISAKPAEIGHVTGLLRGMVTVMTVSHVFSPALDAGVTGFKKRYPDVELHFEAAAWRDIVGALARGDAMLGIGFDETRRPEIDYELLTTEATQLYCGPGHMLYGRTIEDPANVAGEAFVAFGEGEPPALTSFRRSHGFGTRLSGMADSVHEAAWMIGLGLGIGLLPVPLVEASSRSDLWPLLAPGTSPALEVLLMRRAGLQDRATCALVDMIMTQI